MPQFAWSEEEVQAVESSGGSGESGGPSLRDNVQKAIEDLRSAGEKATGDVRSSIDSAVARLRDASGDATSKAQDQVSNWRGTLEDATDDVRKELGKLAIRAQTSLESVDELAKELDERRKSLGGK
jgi:ElaB/YqjD/DUF883 family membrane-anchored ribosome-binding protein